MSSSSLPDPAPDPSEPPLVPSNPMRLERYVPFFLGAIANRWTAVSSKSYREKFDLGIGEWRILASLAVLGSATSLAIAKLVKMDGGAVSRGIRVLEARGLVKPLPGRFAGRTRPYALTEAGLAQFEEMMALALAREQKLLSRLTPEDRSALLRLLAQLYEILDELQD